MTVTNSGLVVKNLSKSYKKRVVLRDVSLEVKQGEAVGLLGPNGAGKTTCFYCITGLIAPTHGIIRLNGTDITQFPVYRRARMGIGYLPQEASIFRGLNVEENIRAVLEIVESNPDKREQELDTLLKEYNELKELNLSFNLARGKPNKEQLDLFEDASESEKRRNLQLMIDEIHNKYGKDIILRMSSLTEASTAKERHSFIGGHRK